MTLLRLHAVGVGLFRELRNGKVAVDLGSRYVLDRVRLVWEPACASKYEVQISADAQEWKTVATRTGRGGTEEIRFRPTDGRYVRMLGMQRATRYGYSLYEFEVFGTPAQSERHPGTPTW